MMRAMLPARHISVSIARPWREVYDFACLPDNLAKWAAGLDVAAKVCVTPPNDYGVIDHDVMATLCEQERGCRADPGRGTGHDADWLVTGLAHGSGPP